MSIIRKFYFRQPTNLSVQILCKQRKLQFQGLQGFFLFPLKKPFRYLQKERSLIFASDKKSTKFKHDILYYSLFVQASLGVSLKYKKQLNIVGIGYQAQVEDGHFLCLKLGFSHIVRIKIPSELNVNCPKPRVIVIQGMNLQKVTNFTSIIKKLKLPSVYKEKGIFYVNEKVSLKQGKKT